MKHNATIIITAMLTAIPALAGVKADCQGFDAGGKVVSSAAFGPALIAKSVPNGFDPDEIIYFDATDPDDAAHGRIIHLGRTPYLVIAETRIEDFTTSTVSWVAIYGPGPRANYYKRVAFKKARSFAGAGELVVTFGVPSVGRIECKGVPTIDPTRAPSSLPSKKASKK